MVIERGKRLSMLISEDERAKLQELAEREGLTASDYVRLFIRKQHAAVFGEAPRKPAKRK